MQYSLIIEKQEISLKKCSHLEFNLQRQLVANSALLVTLNSCSTTVNYSLSLSLFHFLSSLKKKLKGADQSCSCGRLWQLHLRG